MFTLLSALLFGQVAFAAGPWQATILGFPYPEGFTSAQFKIEPTVTPVYEATPAHIKILGTYQTAKQTASGTATPVTGLIVLKGFFSKKDWKLIEFGGTPIRFNKD